MSNNNLVAIEVTTKGYLEKISKLADENNLSFSEYQRECVANAIRTLDPIIQTSKYTWNDFEKNNVMGILNQVAFLELNPSAVPRECYFIIRNTKNQTTNEWYPVIEFGVEGAGNDVILKNFGEVDRIASYIVYEGDDFEKGYVDGWDVKLPRLTRNFKSTKPELVYYLLKKKDGSTDIVYATLDDVKKSLLGHARNNGADDRLIQELDKHSVNELLDSNGKWVNHKIVKEKSVKKGNSYVKEKYEVLLFSPAWTSPVSRDNMIERKLRNHATRKYPKNFKVPFIKEQYEETFDEKYERTNVIDASAEERVEKAQIEFDNKQSKEELKVDVPETKEPQEEQPKKRVEKPNENAGEPLVIENEEETQDEPQSTLDQQNDNESEPEPQNNDVPSWFNS